MGRKQGQEHGSMLLVSKYRSDMLCANDFRPTTGTNVTPLRQLGIRRCCPKQHHRLSAGHKTRDNFMFLGPMQAKGYAGPTCRSGWAQMRPAAWVSCWIRLSRTLFEIRKILLTSTSDCPGFEFDSWSAHVGKTYAIGWCPGQQNSASSMSRF